MILFTMGFIFQPKAVPDSRIQAFFDAFSKLPQRIIMKLDDISNNPHLKVPENVMLKPFVPQQDILAHKNLKLFITHCGMHGVMEAIYHAVPMVGMPVFVDQVCSITYKVCNQFMEQNTLTCQINVYTRLFEFGPISNPHNLIWPYTIIIFWIFFQST